MVHAVLGSVKKDTISVFNYISLALKRKKDVTDIKQHIDPDR